MAALLRLPAAPNVKNVLSALGSREPKSGHAAADDAPTGTPARDAIAQGETVEPAAISGARPVPLEELTEREQEILELIAQGLSNAEIAGRLYVEVSTVKRHGNHILRKVGAANRTQAVARARALGILK